MGTCCSGNAQRREPDDDFDELENRRGSKGKKSRGDRRHSLAQGSGRKGAGSGAAKRTSKAAAKRPGSPRFRSVSDQGGSVNPMLTLSQQQQLQSANSVVGAEVGSLNDGSSGGGGAAEGADAANAGHQSGAQCPAPQTLAAAGDGREHDECLSSITSSDSSRHVAKPAPTGGFGDANSHRDHSHHRSQHLASDAPVNRTDQRAQLPRQGPAAEARDALPLAPIQRGKEGAVLATSNPPLGTELMPAAVGETSSVSDDDNPAGGQLLSEENIRAVPKANDAGKHSVAQWLGRIVLTPDQQRSVRSGSMTSGASTAASFAQRVSSNPQLMRNVIETGGTAAKPVDPPPPAAVVEEPPRRDAFSSLETSKVSQAAPHDGSSHDGAAHAGDGEARPVANSESPPQSTNSRTVQKDSSDERLIETITTQSKNAGKQAPSPQPPDVQLGAFGVIDLNSPDADNHSDAVSSSKDSEWMYDLQALEVEHAARMSSKKPAGEKKKHGDKANVGTKATRPPKKKPP